MRNAAISSSTKPAAMSIGRILLVVFGALMRIPLSFAHPLHASEDITPHPKSANNPSLWAYLSAAAALVLLGGAFAGLTIALMGQDEIYLQVIATSGEGSEKANAKKVLNLLKKGKHWVLVTLLLGNVITNETLPIVLNELSTGYAAVVGSTVLIVIFGEVAPQSVAVRYGLPIGAFMAPFVLLLMWILAPIAWPTAKLLDYLLGEDHGTIYKKAGLKTLVTLHRTLGTTPDERLNKDEVTIISAVLDLKDKPVGSIMTPMADVFTLSADTVLDDAMMNTILAEGYSRIPIHVEGNDYDFIGMLLVKMLITYDPEDCMRVRDFQLATLPETRPETSCLDIVNFFQEGKSHMVLVSDFPGEAYGALGVVTLEDVIEELIGEEIIDESDVFVDVHKAIRRMQPAPRFRVPRGEVVAPRETELPTQDEGELSDSKTKLRPTEHPTDGTETLAISNRPSLSELARSPTAGTTVLMRRRSSGQSEPIALRTTSPDIRQHLRHLGPSNRATRPKQTRINTVKIKPGVEQMATLPETRQLPLDGRRAPSRAQSVREPADATSNENSSLLAGGLEASDAVHAVQYGALSTSPTLKTKDHLPNLNGVMPTVERGRSKPNPSPLSQKVTSPHDENDMPSPKSQPNDSPTQTQLVPFPPLQPQITTEDTDAPKQPAKLVVELERQPSQVSYVGDESDVGELPDIEDDGGFDTIGRRRTQVRSGSITEQIVDIPGGFRKLVLETTSSSEDAEHNPDQADEINATDGTGSTARPEIGGSVSAGEKSGDKKRRKKKHKKQGKRRGDDGPESKALLSGS